MEHRQTVYYPERVKVDAKVIPVQLVAGKVSLRVPSYNIHSCDANIFY